MNLVTVSHKDGLVFDLRVRNRHVQCDMAPADGGRGAGFTPAELAARIRATSCLVLPAVTSTLDIVHELAAEGAPAGTVVLADEQVSGRGREGRRWLSPPGAGLLLGYLHHARGRGETLAGVLAGWGMNILKADAFANSAGVIVDTFQFTDPYRTLELNPSEMERFLASLTVLPVTHRYKIISRTSTFLQAVRLHGWEETLPAGTMIFREDYPRKPARLPRALAKTAAHGSKVCSLPRADNALGDYLDAELPGERDDGLGDQG